MQEQEKDGCEIGQEHSKIYPNYLNGQEVKKEKLMQERLSRRLKSLPDYGMGQKKVEDGTQDKEKEIGQQWYGLREYVNNVVTTTRQFTQNDQCFVPSIVGIDHIELQNKVPVYDLTVYKDHCFYANGILVSNCGDEYDDWAEDIFPTIIRPNLITHKAPVIFAGTPKGFRNLYRLEKNKEFKSFHYTSMDNPDIDKEELESLIREYKEMGMSYYRQEILAEYEKPVGTVYEEWDMDKQYVPIYYNPNLPIHISWDFGINDPTAVMVLQPYGKELRLIDYIEANNTSLKFFTDWIDDLPYKKPELETGDIAGRARSLVTGKSVIDEAMLLGHVIMTARIPDIPTQIRHAHKSIPYLYVNSANPHTERFVECLLNYKYPEKSESLINQSNEIPVHDEFSHGMRAFEYYCWNVISGQYGAVLTDQLPITQKNPTIVKDGHQIPMDMSAWEKPIIQGSTRVIGGE